MGSNKRLIVSATGFPGTTETWRFIQQAWSEPLRALATLTGNMVIVSGMRPVSTSEGSYTQSGFISYEGIIYPFEGGINQTSVTMITEVVNSTYDVDLDNDGQQDVLPQYETKFFRFGTGGSVTFLFSDLKRLKTIQQLSNFTLPDGVVIDPNYFPISQALINSLKNVQADWNVTNSSNDGYVKNKPNLFKPLRIGSSYLGDFPNAAAEKRTINFPSVGTSNYLVVGSYVAVGNWGDNCNVIWSIGAKTASSFELLGREIYPIGQNLRFEYMLIPFNQTLIQFPFTL